MGNSCWNCYMSQIYVSYELRPYRELTMHHAYRRRQVFTLFVFLISSHYYYTTKNKIFENMTNCQKYFSRSWFVLIVKADNPIPYPTHHHGIPWKVFFWPSPLGNGGGLMVFGCFDRISAEAKQIKATPAQGYTLASRELQMATGHIKESFISSNDWF